ncbi:hypothetical protein OG689_19320 [Kitasatospora sp. NBC_00240]|uniref:hypothetical protein n=1 Tax=Kitasatospora sp. NBC_00240 TaxID=2903567 RepID=UPI0022582921|nr:hypothetical protein [Kitasatospora sp. NBC_00240]MCX5211411.1 hypothetical protein [Kitasatospora sp. NBC_00240]
MPAKRFVYASIACALLAAGATACGGDTAGDKAGDKAGAAAPPAKAESIAVDKLGAEEIVKQAQTAMGGLQSVKVDGTLTVDGGKLTFDLAASKAGDCTGSVGTGSEGKVEVVRIGSQTWIKPDAVFWNTVAAKEGNARSGAVLAELFKGRYITNGQDDPSLKEMAQVCDLVGAISKDDGTSGDKYTKGAAADVNGTKAFSVTATDSDGENSTLYIATQGKPYLVRMEQTAGAEPGQLTFSDFDKPLDLKAPPADNVIDFSMVKQKLRPA